MDKRYSREYTWDEWSQLPDSLKRKISINYWCSESGAGKETRSAILEAYLNEFPQISENALKVDFRDFGDGVFVITVAVKDHQFNFRKTFDIFLVSKGVVREIIPENEALVYWQGIGPTKEIIKL